MVDTSLVILCITCLTKLLAFFYQLFLCFSLDVIKLNGQGFQWTTGFCLVSSWCCQSHELQAQYENGARPKDTVAAAGAAVGGRMPRRAGQARAWHFDRLPDHLAIGRSNRFSIESRLACLRCCGHIPGECLYRPQLVAVEPRYRHRRARNTRQRYRTKKKLWPRSGGIDGKKADQQPQS